MPFNYVNYKKTEKKYHEEQKFQQVDSNGTALSLRVGAEWSMNWHQASKVKHQWFRQF